MFCVYFRLQTSTLLDEFHRQLLQAPLHFQLLLPRELQPLPEMHPVLLSGAHCVPSVGSQQLLQWVQCEVHHPQPDEVCELQSTATALLGSQRGNPVVVGDTVMQSE